MGKMTVYHGSYLEIAEPRIIAGKYTKDFGVGFYCTEAALKCLEFRKSEEVFT